MQRYKDHAKLQHAETQKKTSPLGRGRQRIRRRIAPEAPDDTSGGRGAILRSPRKHAPPEARATCHLRIRSTGAIVFTRRAGSVTTSPAAVRLKPTLPKPSRSTREIFPG